MRNQPKEQPKKETRDFSVFKPTHKGPLPKPAAPKPAPAPQVKAPAKA